MLEIAEPFTELLARRAETRGVPPAPVETFVLAAEPFFEEEEDVGVAEGQSFVIEYRDGRGQASRRRITVWSIKRGADTVPILQSICHERNAYRPFRVDRITCCIDYDGEIFDDVPAFMAETFGMAPWQSTARPPEPKVRKERSPRPPAPRWIDLRNLVKHHATLMSALSHCDGLMCSDEVGATVYHALDMARAAGLPVSADATTELGAYVRRLHPTRRTVLDAVEFMLRENPDEQRRFFLAALVVIDADGHRHPEEIAMVNAFAVDLLGTPLF